MSQERVCFLVGAGLVKDAGLPTSIELAHLLKEDLEKRCADKTITEDERQQTKRLLALCRLLNGGVRFQEGFLDRDPDSPVNIEQIAVAALSLRKRLQDPVAPFTSGWHQRLSELEDYDAGLMDAFIDYIYSRLEHWLTFRSEASISYLARLADTVNANRSVDIFSLNYDICIETALSADKRVTWVNGFTEDGWTPGEFGSDAAVRLFKLHGSLDWIEDELYGVCSLRMPQHVHAEDIAGTRKPLLIFGTNNKLSARQPFLTLAYHLSQAVSRTRVLAVIGYSFGDMYVNEIIEQGFRSNTQLRLILVARNASRSLARHELFADSPRVVAIDSNAKDALNDGYIRGKIEELLADSSGDDVFPP